MQDAERAKAALMARSQAPQEFAKRCEELRARGCVCVQKPKCLHSALLCFFPLPYYSRFLIHRCPPVIDKHRIDYAHQA